MQTNLIPIARFHNLRPLYLVGILLLFLEFNQLPRVHAQSACQHRLINAEQSVKAGEWNEAIHALNSGLETEECSLTEREELYVLLALAYDAKGERDFARASLRKLLRIVPNWKPDPEIASPSFQSLAQEALAEAKGEQANATPSPSCKKWPWFTVGAAVVSGAIVYLIFNDEEKEPSLTLPPSLP